MRILIKVKDDKLLFATRKRLNNDDKTIINTNLISNDEIFFTDDYVKDKDISIKLVMLKDFSKDLGKILDKYKNSFFLAPKNEEA